VTRASLRFLPAVLITAAGLALTIPSAIPLGAQAREPTPLPRFEVASIKPSTGPTGERGQPGGRYAATRPVRFFIADAFFFGTPLQMSRVLGGPDWIDSALYEVNAKASTELRASADGPPRELFLMIRSLLQERFKLKTHMETRELPVYELVLARPDGSLGPQLRQATIDCDALMEAVRAGAPPPARQPNEPPPCGAMRGPARVLAGSFSRSQLANMLTFIIADANGPAGRDAARLVIDKTGLSGRFAFTLAWTPEQIPETPPPPGIPPIDPNGPPLVTALQEQLGLKLQSARSLMEVVVIDSVERPTPD
jgi:bla regulator protein blaR1